MKKIVNINDLIPTQISLTSETLKFYGQSRIPEDHLPDIWDIDGRLLIADGHNSLYYSLNKGINEIEVNYFNSNEYPIMEFIYTDLRVKADYCEGQGINKIRDLKL